VSEHLDDIQSYYFLDPENKREIKAISKVDCDIIENIILIVERMGNKEFSEILHRWKDIPDQDTLLALEDYLQSEDLEEYMKAKGGDFIEKLLDKMKSAYIKIGDEYLQSHKIFTIGRRERHNGSRPVYSIVVNDEKYLPDKTSSWYSNLSVDFFTIDEREEELNNIKRLIRNNTMCKFIN
jgi:hypothetical protein